MQSKFSVALQLEVAHHFIERCAGERSRRFESPATFGATKTPKTRLLNPYQFPAHGCRCRCAQRRLTACLAPACRQWDEAFSFRSGVLPDCSRKLSPVWDWLKWVKGTGTVYVPQFRRSVGHPTYAEDFSSCARRFWL